MEQVRKDIYDQLSNISDSDLNNSDFTFGLEINNNEVEISILIANENTENNLKKQNNYIKLFKSREAFTSYGFTLIADNFVNEVMVEYENLISKPLDNYIDSFE